MTVNVAMVGLGYWGPNLARNIAVVSGARLHTLCDSRPDRLDRFAAQYPWANRTANFEDVLEDRDIDAIVLATPARTHHALALAALQAGKHMFVEKPLASSSAECEELIAAADAAGRVLMVGHVFVYNAAVRKVSEYIDSGELGQIRYIYSQRLNLGQVRSDANALWNFGPHDLSILAYWLRSDPVHIVARGFDFLQSGLEDVVFMTLDYPGGIGANVHISWLDPLKVRRMTVVGSEKMVVYDDVSADARVVLYDKGFDREPAKRDPLLESLGTFESFSEFQLLLRAGDILIPKVDFAEPLKVELEHFVECVATGATPETDGRSGLRIVQALEMAQRSLEEHRSQLATARTSPRVEGRPER